MKKILLPLLALVLIAGLLFINYGGFYLLQGTWVCEKVSTSLIDGGASGAVFSLAGALGAEVTLRFDLANVYFSARGFGYSTGETAYGYLAQSGRLIVGDFAFRFQIRGNQLVLSNTAGDQLVFTKRQ